MEEKKTTKPATAKTSAKKTASTKTVAEKTKAPARKADKQVKITLIHSAISTTPKQRATLKALGLKKINQTKIMPDNAAVRGMIKVVAHLVQVVE